MQVKQPRQWNLQQWQQRTLAQVSEKELNALKDSGVMQLTKQMESLKLAMAPIGEMVANVLIPILSFGEKILSAFNGLDEGVKKAIGGDCLTCWSCHPSNSNV